MCKSTTNTAATSMVCSNPLDDHFPDLPRLSRSLDMPTQQRQQQEQQQQASASVVEFGKPASAAVLVLSLPAGSKAGDKQEAEFYAHDDGLLQRWPTSAEVVDELKRMGAIACPMVVTGLLVYLRSMISMLFLGRLGDLELAGGSLAIGFANITGYSVLSGLAMGMEPICGQAFGAKKWKLMGLTLQRSVVFLLCSCLPIALLWLNMRRILIFCGQDPGVTATAHVYLVYSLPDLAVQAVLNPLRIYLRTQKITLPISVAAAAALSLHVPINILLVNKLELGIEGVAVAAVMTNFNLVVCLLLYVRVTGIYKRSWPGLSTECLRDWRPLLNLAIPSCISVCLEWWWYELMIIFSGLLVNARACVATMGVLIQTTALVYIFPSSLGLAVSTRVGNELGANRPWRARVAAHVALCCAGLLGLAAMSFTVGMRHVWGSIFTRDADILKLVAIAMPVVGMCELGNCPQTTGCGVLRGSARPSLGANINLGSFYFIGMPVAMLLGFALDVGFVGLWFGLLAAQASCLVLMLFAVARTDWEQQALRAQELTGSAADEKSPVVEQNQKCFELCGLDDDDEDESAEVSGEEAGKGLNGGDQEQVPLISIKVVDSETAMVTMGNDNPHECRNTEAGR